MDGDRQLRIPPQSISSEQAVLGGLLIRNDAWAKVNAELSEGDFYRRDHQLIFRAIQELAGKEQPYDYLTVTQWFEDRGMVEQVANGAYLIELASTTPSAANIKAYAQIVADKATLRRLINAGTDAVNAGFDPEGQETDHIVAHAATQMAAVMRSKGKAAVSSHTALKGLYVEMIAAFEATDDLVGLPTGNAELDDLTSGLQAGRVYGIGGRPKMGKSTLAKEIIRHNIDRDTPVALWTMEMSEQEMMRGLIAAHTRIDSRKLQRPKLLHEDEWTKVTEGIRHFKDCPLTIFPERGITIERVEAEAANLVAQGKCKLIVLDYLSLFSLPKADRHDIAVGHIMRRCKVMAGNLNVPVIILFQLNRGNETGAQVRAPRASDAKDSGNIEQDLDCMILLHRPSYYDKSAPKGTQIDIPIQRNGPSGTVYVMEELEYGIFKPGGELRFDHSSSKKRDSKKAAANDIDDGFPA